MKPKLIFAFAAIVGAAAGFAGGRQLSSARASEASLNSVRHVPPVDRAGTNGTESPARGSRSLPHLIRLARNHEAQGDPVLLRELERLSGAELRELVIDLLSHLPRNHSPDSEAGNRLLTTALKQWYLREGEEAFHQTDLVEDKEVRTILMHRLLQTAAREHPKLAKAWAERFSEEVGQNAFRNTAMSAASGALTRSAEDFLEVIKLFPDLQMQMSASMWSSYAEDFDFRQAIEGAPEMSGLVARWATKEPEEAWSMAKNAISERGEKATIYAGEAFLGIATVKGDEVAAVWLAEKLTEIPDDMKFRALRSLQSVDILSPERSAIVMAALGDPADKVRFASIRVDPHRDQAQGVATLEALPPDLQVEALFATAQRYAPGMRNGGQEHFDKVHGYFDDLMEQMNLSTESREKVKATLDPEGVQ